MQTVNIPENFDKTEAGGNQKGRNIDLGTHKLTVKGVKLLKGRKDTCNIVEFDVVSTSNPDAHSVGETVSLVFALSQEMAIKDCKRFWAFVLGPLAVREDKLIERDPDAVTSQDIGRLSDPDDVLHQAVLGVGIRVTGYLHEYTNKKGEPGKVVRYNWQSITPSSQLSALQAQARDEIAKLKSQAA